MTQAEFEQVLNDVCAALTAQARNAAFTSAVQFEDKVRHMLQEALAGKSISIDLTPNPQAFPDIAIGNFGVEVKFSLSDSWRSVANSVQESNRIQTVSKVYLVFGKMGGTPEVHWGDYEQCIIHVRTSHVPRFEVELFADRSLFQGMGISYDAFRQLDMPAKMQHIRSYARSRLKAGERLWWLEDSPDAQHTLPIQARLYTSLPLSEKTQLRAEAAVLCPAICGPAQAKNKYNDVVLYLLTYHGVICHQARDLFSAGSVANPDNDDEGGVYIERALKAIESEMTTAALRMDDALFVEYWGESVLPALRIRRWLEKADAVARDWRPSESLFNGPATHG